jgi:prevent-host-death family protein
MKPLRVSQDVVPIAQFKAQAGRWLKKAAETGQPVVITLNGKPAGVLLSPAEYDRLEEEQRYLDEKRRFLDSIAAGLADVEAGRVVSTDEVRREFGLAPVRRRRGTRK